MPFDSALNSTQLEYLRGTASTPPSWRGKVYLSVGANTNVYTARINQSAFLFPLPELTYDTGSGTLADVVAGMTVLISHTSDRADAYWRGRVRKAPTATTLYINEAGNEGFADNDYIFILDDFGIETKLPRAVAGTPVADWDTSYRRLKPLITNLRSAYVGFVSGSALTISFAPTVEAADSDATSSFTYAWDPQDGTITVGTASSKDITVTFPAGFRWVYFTATDSNGVSLTRRIPVWAHNTSSNQPAPLEYANLQIEVEIPANPEEGTGGGYAATFDAFDGVDSILDNTLVCIWVADQTLSGTAADLGSAGNVLMVGRLRDEENSTQYLEDGQRDDQVTLVVEGPLLQLANRRAVSIEILDDNAPDAFFEVEALSLERAIWLLCTELSTLAELHSVRFPGGIAAHRYGPGLTTQGGDLLNSMADLAMSGRMIIQDNPAGMIEIASRTTMLLTSDRSSVTVLANWTTSDFGDSLRYRRDHFPAAGLLRGAGGGYNTGLQSISPWDLRAPAGTPGSGPVDVQLMRQIAVHDLSEANLQAELVQRAGDALAIARNSEVITVRMPDAYHWLTPDVGTRHTLTVPSTVFTRGKAFTTATNWWLQAKSLSVNPQDGTVDVDLTFHKETDGADGEIVIYPDIDYGTWLPSLGNLLDLGTVISLPNSADSDSTLDLSLFEGDPTYTENGSYGGGVLSGICTGGQMYIDGAWSLGGLKTIKTVSITYIATASVTALANYLYLRTSGNFYQAVGTWNTQAGTHTVSFDFGSSGIMAEFLRVTVYGDDDACADTIQITDIDYTTVAEETWREVFDFTAANGGWEARINPEDLLPGAAYTAGVGWEDTDYDIATDNWERAVGIQRTFEARTLTRAKVSYSVTRGTGVGGYNDMIYFDDYDNPVATRAATSNGTFVLEWTGSSNQSQVNFKVWCSQDALPLSGTAVITQVILEGTGSNPFR